MKNKTEFVRNIYAFEGQNKISIEDNDEEINLLFKLLETYLDKQLDDLFKKNIRIKIFPWKVY